MAFARVPHPANREHFLMVCIIHRRSRFHAVGVSLLALLSTPAFAQQTAPNSEVAAEDQNDSEVVVTARRREERAQDVPIALSVVSGQTIERTGNTNLVQIADLTPSLTIRNNNARNTFVNIRGLGSKARCRPWRRR
jgi:iron complex outermembrane receptor protein